MAVLLALYIVLIGWRAVQFVRPASPIAVVIGVALIVLPLVGAWALVRELLFGIRSQRLVAVLDAEGALPEETLPDPGRAGDRCGRPPTRSSPATRPRSRPRRRTGAPGSGWASPTTRPATAAAPARPSSARSRWNAQLTDAPEAAHPHRRP